MSFHYEDHHIVGSIPAVRDALERNLAEYLGHKFYKPIHHSGGSVAVRFMLCVPDLDTADDLEDHIAKTYESVLGFPILHVYVPLSTTFVEPDVTLFHVYVVVGNKATPKKKVNMT